MLMKKHWTLTFTIFILYIFCFISISLIVRDVVLTIIIGAPLLFYIPGKIILNYIQIKYTISILPIGISVLIAGIIYIIYSIIIPAWAEFVTIATISSISIIYCVKIYLRTNYFINIYNRFTYLNELSKKEKIVLSISIALLLILTSFTIALISQQKDFVPFSEIYIINKDKNAFGYYNTVQNGSDFTLILGVSNNEGRSVSYSVLCFLVEVQTINQTTVIPSSMLFQGQRDVTLNGDSPEIDSRWGGQWESVWTFDMNNVGNYKLYFFLFKDEIPEYLAGLTVNNDYHMTEVSNLLFDTMHSEILSVNLNVEVID